MGNDQGGSALGQGIEGPLDLGLRDRVQRGGGLVQDQNGRILQKHTGNGHPLLLSTGQKRAPLAHIRIEALGHCQNILVDLRLFGRLHHFFEGGIGLSVADILKDRVSEQEYILLDDANVAVQRLLGHIPDIQAINGDGTLGNIVEPGNQLT